MQKDKVLPSNSCLSVFVKRDVLDLPEKFFSMAMNPEFTPDLYATNYDQQMDAMMKRISAYYHLDKHRLALSIDSNMSDSKSNI